VPVLAAIAIAATAALPAHAQTLAPAAAAAGTTDAIRADQWWLTALGMTQAWRAAPGKGNGVTVAVLSTGVDRTHPDLAGSVTVGPDYSGTIRHQGGSFWGAEGTAVASLIAGHGHGTGRADGITGLAPGARILSVQVTVEYNDSQLTGDNAVISRLPAAIAAGIRYAVGHGATVIALPLDPGTIGPAGGSGRADGSKAEQAAVSYAVGHGVLLIAPAGDNGASSGTLNYPADYPGVVAVGATERNGKLCSFSVTRSYVALTAPGAGDTTAGTALTNPAYGLRVAAPGGGYDSLASTDMAAALTAGVAALIRGRYPSLTVAQVAQALDHSTGGKPGATPRPGYGHGALNAAAALTAASVIAAHQRPAVTPSPTASTPAQNLGSPAATPTPRASGSSIKSLLVDLVIGACGLVAIGVGVMMLTGSRRRRALAARSVQPPRTTGHTATHAKNRTPLAIEAPPGRPRTSGWPQTATSRGAFTAIGAAEPPAPRQIQRPPTVPARPPAVPARLPAVPARPPVAPARPSASPARPPASAARPPAVPAKPPAGAPRSYRERQSGELPPWDLESNLPVVAGRPVPGDHSSQPPWEISPGTDLRPAVPVEDPGSWPVTSTGPMYVWNPAATGPQHIMTEDDER
jgi:subtilisin family serine protease